MRTIPVASLALALALTAAATEHVAVGGPKLFIEPQNGYESYIAAAIIKKDVPVTMVQDKAAAVFILTSAVVSNEESTGGKVARCLFLYCAGIEGLQTATVQLVTPKGEIVWAYNVRKASAHNFQSTAESIAKHLREYLAKHNEEPKQKKHKRS